MLISACSSKGSPAITTSDKNDGSVDSENGQAIEEIDVSEITEFYQSPMLDDKGLPDVAERLPKVPKIPNEMPQEFLTFEIGKYGGTLNTVAQSVNWDPDLF